MSTGGRWQTKEQEIPSIDEVLKISRNQVIQLCYQIARTAGTVAGPMDAVGPIALALGLGARRCGR